MGKTYSIRKVGGGGGSSRPLKKKKKQVLVSFPHSATPLVLDVIFLQTQQLSCLFQSVIQLLILCVYQLCAASGFVSLGVVSECWLDSRDLHGMY